MKNTRLSGHTLRFEGAPYTREGRLVHPLGLGPRGVGRGKCSCGALSDEFDTPSQRKRWHREHKDAIRAQAVQP